MVTAEVSWGVMLWKTDTVSNIEPVHIYTSYSIQFHGYCCLLTFIHCHVLVKAQPATVSHEKMKRMLWQQSTTQTTVTQMTHIAWFHDSVSCSRASALALLNSEILFGMFTAIYIRPVYSFFITNN